MNLCLYDLYLAVFSSLEIKTIERSDSNLFFFQVSLMSALIEDNLILTSDSAVCYDVVLVKLYEENLVPHRYVVGKGGVF